MVPGTHAPQGSDGWRGVRRGWAPAPELLPFDPYPLGRVAEWQTRWLQVPVFERMWGFKSPLAHRFRGGFPRKSWSSDHL